MIHNEHGNRGFVPRRYARTTRTSNRCQGSCIWMAELPSNFSLRPWMYHYCYLDPEFSTFRWEGYRFHSKLLHGTHVFHTQLFFCVYVFCWLQGCRESLFADSDSYLELYAMLRQWWSQDINLQSIVLTTTTSRNLSLKWWFMSAYLLYVVEMLRDSTRSH